MQHSISYWVTFYEDDGKEICSVPVIGYMQPTGIQIDVNHTEKIFVDTVQSNSHRRFHIEPACVDVTLTEQPVVGILPSVNNENGGYND